MTVRWVFPDPSEAAERQRIEAQIDAWWASLSSNHVSAEGVPSGPELTSRLRAIHPALCVELRRRRTGSSSLVVTCEAERWLQPLVDTIVARAPKNVGFTVCDSRTAEPASLALTTVEGLCGVDTSGWSPRVEAGPFGLLSIEWNGSARHESAGAVLAQALLGEQAMGDWVGAISVTSKGLLGRVFGRAAPEALVERFDELRRAIISKTADRPLLIFSNEPKDRAWPLLSVDVRHDRSACHQPDLERARTANVDFFAASRAGAPFSSCRFSRFGERFAYLQLEGFADDGLRNTLQVEEALDRALGSLGRVIGGGSGARYSYIDLVFAEVRAAVPIVVDVLRQGRLPRHSWLRFFDDVWEKEWVGVWPETPPPSGG